MAHHARMALPGNAIPRDTARHHSVPSPKERVTVLWGAADLTAMRADRALHVGLLCSEPVIEGFALAFLARRHPELVGLAPILGRIDHRVAVVVADLIG